MAMMALAVAGLGEVTLVAVPKLQKVVTKRDSTPSDND